MKDDVLLQRQYDELKASSTRQINALQRQVLVLQEALRVAGRKLPDPALVPSPPTASSAGVPATFTPEPNAALEILKDVPLPSAVDHQQSTPPIEISKKPKRVKGRG